MSLTLLTISPTRAHPDVLRAMAEQQISNDDPAVIAAFRSSLLAFGEVLGSAACQGFIVPGTGTLGLDALAANWLTPGARVLVASTGYWGDRFALVAERHGADVHHAKVAPGAPPDIDAIERELREGGYTALAWTHVDSSTGVCADNAALANLAWRHGALSIVDGIAAAGAEPVRQDERGIDVYLTATPKALAVPAGLFLISASARALEALEQRSEPVRVYALDLLEWLPVMRAFEAGQFAYFNSPALNLVVALSVGLQRILDEGLEARFARHARTANLLRDKLRGIGIEPVARDDCRSAALTAFWYPEGIDKRMLSAVRDEGVLLAGGYHPEIGARTFRIGHFGWVNDADVQKAVVAIGRVLAVTP